MSSDKVKKQSGLGHSQSYMGISAGVKKNASYMNNNNTNNKNCYDNISSSNSGSSSNSSHALRRSATQTQSMMPVRFRRKGRNREWTPGPGQHQLNAELRDRLLSHSIMKIDVCGAKIGDLGAEILAQLLQTNSSLEVLLLRHNRITKKGAIAIAISITHHRTLHTLDMWSNRVGDQGAVNFGLLLFQNQSALTCLNLADNRIGPKGGVAIAKGLMFSKRLAMLNLEDNKLDDSAGEALAKSLTDNISLTSLNLYGNPLSLMSTKAFAVCLRTNRSLTAVYLQCNVLPHNVEANDPILSSSPIWQQSIDQALARNALDNKVRNRFKPNQATKPLRPAVPSPFLEKIVEDDNDQDTDRRIPPCSPARHFWVRLLPLICLLDANRELFKISSSSFAPSSSSTLPLSATPMSPTASTSPTSSSSLTITLPSSSTSSSTSNAASSTRRSPFFSWIPTLFSARTNSTVVTGDVTNKHIPTVSPSTNGTTSTPQTSNVTTTSTSSDSLAVPAVMTTTLARSPRRIPGSAPSPRTSPRAASSPKVVVHCLPPRPSHPSAISLMDGMEDVLRTITDFVLASCACPASAQDTERVHENFLVRGRLLTAFDEAEEEDEGDDTADDGLNQEDHEGQVYDSEDLDSDEMSRMTSSQLFKVALLLAGPP